jgi:hypothetical protein
MNLSKRQLQKMPRINIEEKWWGDLRRQLLIEKLGMGTADGAFFFAVRVSHNQEEIFNSKKLIPKAWAVALLEVGLAEGSLEEFYVCGTREHNAWLKKQRELGKKGGEAKANKNKEMRLADPKPTLSQGVPSSSSSSSKENRTYMASSASPNMADLFDPSNGEQKRFDFNQLFKKYPKRLGDHKKTKAFQTLTRTIKTQADYEAMELAISHYSEAVEKENKAGTVYVKQFATFVNEVWKEYLVQDQEDFGLKNDFEEGIKCNPYQDREPRI